MIKSGKDGQGIPSWFSQQNISPTVISTFVVWKQTGPVDTSRPG